MNKRDLQKEGFTVTAVLLAVGTTICVIFDAHSKGTGLLMVSKSLAKNSQHSARHPWRNCQLCVSRGRSGDQLSWQKRLAVDCPCSRLSYRPGYKTARLNAKGPNVRTATSQIFFLHCGLGMLVFGLHMRAFVWLCRNARCFFAGGWIC